MDLPRSLDELAKNLRNLGMNGFEPVRLQAAGQTAHGLSGGVEQTKRFGFVPPGKNRDLQAVTVLVPKDQRPASFPSNGISLVDRNGEFLVGEAVWSIVSEENVDGNWVVNLNTDR